MDLNIFEALQAADAAIAAANGPASAVLLREPAPPKQTRGSSTLLPFSPLHIAPRTKKAATSQGAPIAGSGTGNAAAAPRPGDFSAPVISKDLLLASKQAAVGSYAGLARLQKDMEHAPARVLSPNAVNTSPQVSAAAVRPHYGGTSGYAAALPLQPTPPPLRHYSAIGAAVTPIYAPSIHAPAAATSSRPSADSAFEFAVKRAMAALEGPPPEPVPADSDYLSSLEVINNAGAVADSADYAHEQATLAGPAGHDGPELQPATAYSSNDIDRKTSAHKVEPGRDDAPLHLYDGPGLSASFWVHSEGEMGSGEVGDMDGRNGDVLLVAPHLLGNVAKVQDTAGATASMSEQFDAAVGSRESSAASRSTGTIGASVPEVSPVVAAQPPSTPPFHGGFNDQPGAGTIDENGSNNTAVHVNAAPAVIDELRLEDLSPIKAPPSSTTPSYRSHASAMSEAPANDGGGGAGTTMNDSAQSTALDDSRATNNSHELTAALYHVMRGAVLAAGHSDVATSAAAAYAHLIDDSALNASTASATSLAASNEHNTTSSYEEGFDPSASAMTLSPAYTYAAANPVAAATNRRQTDRGEDYTAVRAPLGGPSDLNVSVWMSRTDGDRDVGVCATAASQHAPTAHASSAVPDHAVQSASVLLKPALSVPSSPVDASVGRKGIRRPPTPGRRVRFALDEANAEGDGGATDNSDSDAFRPSDGDRRGEVAPASSRPPSELASQLQQVAETAEYLAILNQLETELGQAGIAASAGDNLADAGNHRQVAPYCTSTTAQHYGPGITTEAAGPSPAAVMSGVEPISASDGLLFIRASEQQFSRHGVSAAVGLNARPVVRPLVRPLGRAGAGVISAMPPAPPEPQLQLQVVPSPSATAAPASATSPQQRYASPAAVDPATDPAASVSASSPSAYSIAGSVTAVAPRSPHDHTTMRLTYASPATARTGDTSVDGDASTAAVGGSASPQLLSPPSAPGSLFSPTSASTSLFSPTQIEREWKPLARAQTGIAVSADASAAAYAPSGASQQHSPPSLPTAASLPSATTAAAAPANDAPQQQQQTLTLQLSPSVDPSLATLLASLHPVVAPDGQRMFKMSRSQYDALLARAAEGIAASAAAKASEHMRAAGAAAAAHFTSASSAAATSISSSSNYSGFRNTSRPAAKEAVKPSAAASGIGRKRPAQLQTWVDRLAAADHQGASSKALLARRARSISPRPVDASDNKASKPGDNRATADGAAAASTSGTGPQWRGLQVGIGRLSREDIRARSKALR